MTDPSSNGSTKPERNAKVTRVAEHKSASPLASQRAAAILDVLAGQRTTSEAAAALEISVNHYYLLERKALEGLTAACEPRGKGTKGPSLGSQLQSLQRQLEQCRRECLRQSALVRATQRAVGLAAVPEPKKAGRRKTKTATRRRKKGTPTNSITAGGFASATVMGSVVATDITAGANAKAEVRGAALWARGDVSGRKEEREERDTHKLNHGRRCRRGCESVPQPFRKWSTAA